VKVPPVVFEIVTATLVAFTVMASATEPDAIVSVVAGEVRKMFVGAVYVRGAAFAGFAWKPQQSKPRAIPRKK
jgi:hypothetical protein